MMTERVAEKNPTLLTYLEPLQPGLRLYLHSAGRSKSEKDVYFEIFNASGGFSGLMAGAIGAGEGRPFCDLILAVQPDRYPFYAAELFQATNPQVEALWQAAFARLYGAPRSTAHIFTEQVDAQGRLLPWRPLWHCGEKGRFAHPLCPLCGAGLELCREDRLLEGAGLPAYSQSLERFLFCPACASKEPDWSFYAPAARPGSSNRLHEGALLVRSMVNLLDRQDLAAELPCVGCQAAGECFGPKALVSRRLQPIFFYPFFMIMQPSASIGSDFLGLLSGTSFQAITGAESIAKKVLAAQKVETAAAPQPAEPVRPADPKANDAKIVEILQDILRQWSAGAPEAVQPVVFPKDAQKPLPVAPISPAAGVAIRSAPIVPDADGDFQETIILGGQAEQAAQPLEASAFSPDPLERTVLIGAGEGLKKEQELLEQTARIGGAEAPEPAGPSQGFLEATLMISTHGLAPKPPAETVQEQGSVAQEPSAASPPEDDLEQTVIIGPRAAANGAATPSPAEKQPKRAPAAAQAPPPAGRKPSWDDELEQTIIIQPDPSKNRKTRS